MIGGFIFVLILCITDTIIQAMRLQQNNEDGRAWLSMLAQLTETLVIGGMFIYYLLYIHPVMTSLGR